MRGQRKSFSDTFILTFVTKKKTAHKNGAGLRMKKKDLRHTPFFNDFNFNVVTTLSVVVIVIIGHLTFLVSK